MRAKGPGQSALLLLDVIGVLNALRVPYAIVGAMAASFYGVVRASLDADAVVSLRAGRVDVNTLVERIEKAGLKNTYRTGDFREPIGATLRVEDPFNNRADLLMDIRGMTDAAFARAVDAHVRKVKVRMIGLEDFLAMKLFAGSPKDLSDAAGALAVSSRTLKLALLREVVQPYGRDASQRLRALLEARRPR